MVSSKNINMKGKKTEIEKNWLEPILVCNIQVFLSFVNFY